MDCTGSHRRHQQCNERGIEDNPDHAKAVGFLSAPQIQAEFCKDYPAAKNMLNMLAPMLAWWPVEGPTASLILKGLLALGDELYKDGCST